MVKTPGFWWWPKSSSNTWLVSIIFSATNSTHLITYFSRLKERGEGSLWWQMLLSTLESTAYEYLQRCLAFWDKQMLSPPKDKLLCFTPSGEKQIVYIQHFFTVVLRDRKLSLNGIQLIKAWLKLRLAKEFSEWLGSVLVF